MLIKLEEVESRTFALPDPVRREDEMPSTADLAVCDSVILRYDQLIYKPIEPADITDISVF